LQTYFKFQSIFTPESVYANKISEVIVKVNGKEETIHRKIMGIYPKRELVSSHICRRTFATLLYGKIYTLTIMKITGHQTELEFLGVIKSLQRICRKLKSVPEKP
jgi:integrase